MQVFHHEKYKEAKELSKVFDVDSFSANVKYAGRVLRRITLPYDVIIITTLIR